MNHSAKSEILAWIKTLIIAAVVVFVLRHFFITPSIVEGDSMEPSLQDGDRIIISKVGKIERYDEIAFHAPDSNNNYVKRVIGLPGDEIRMKEDTLYINGEPVEEPYLKEAKASLPETFQFTRDFTLQEVAGAKQVPEGHLFVLGDNRSISKDSRYFGFISEKAIIGDVTIRIWPIDTFGFPE